MKKITCIIVDDEPLALDLLEGYVNQTPFLQFSGRCSNVYEAVEKINESMVNLVFLDIQMPGLNGLDFSKTLSKDQRVIFTTAFEKYALDGFKVDALDFLLKPFNYQEFLKASNKAKEWFDLKQGNQQPDTNAFIFVKSEYKQLKVSFKDILYFENVKDYIKIWLDNEVNPIMTLMSMKSLEEILPVSFMRIHRSYIISLDKIQEIERNQVVINNKRITVSEQYKENFYKYIAGKLL